MEKSSLIDKLHAASALTRRLGMILNLKSFLRELARASCELATCERAVVLLADSENATLSVAAIAGAEASQMNRSFSIYNQQDDRIVSAWLHREPRLVQRGEIGAHSPLYHLIQALAMDGFYSVPLHVGETLAGVILVDNFSDHAPLNPVGIDLLEAIQDSAEIALANARLYSRTVAELDARMREVEMMRQIDRELSDTIALERVFDLTLDWALRFTLAQGASLSLYNDDSDELRFVADLGYNSEIEQALVQRAKYGGIALRVARSGHAELIPDVAVDPDYIAVSNVVRSHMSVPVMREDRVIAVITVESRRLNAFTDEHVSFVAKLATRAGVAIDNARLYSESVREREKLSHIVDDYFH